MHQGIDFTTTIGQDIVAPIAGRVRNFKGIRTKYPMLQIFPGKRYTDFHYMEILYVKPPEGARHDINMYRSIKAGEVIGRAKSLQKLKYPC